MQQHIAVDAVEILVISNQNGGTADIKIIEESITLKIVNTIIINLSIIFFPQFQYSAPDPAIIIK